MSDKGKKRGAIVAGVVLILVVGLAVVAYGKLAPKRVAMSDDTGSIAASASSIDSSSTSASAQDTPLLADHDATVYTALNEPLKLTDIANGRPLIMNFWTTWCPYCVQEMPDYQQIYNEYKDRVSFAFIDCVGSKGETAEKALDWLRENGCEDLPAYFDNNREATSTYGAWSLPTTVIISAQGEILDLSAGAINPDLMRRTLDTLV